MGGDRELFASDSMLRDLLASTTVMMGVVEVLDDDSDIIHVYDSPATHRFFGFAPGTMAGNPSSALGVPRPVIERWIQQYRESERQGREVRFEYVHPGSTGPLWLASIVASMGRSASGRARFSYVTDDITERRRAEQRLRDREMHLRLAMDASLVIAFEWDVVHDRVRRLQSVEEALPETQGGIDNLEGVVRVVHPEDRALFRANISAALASHDGAYRSEHRIVRPTGEVRWLMESGRVELDAEHRPLRLVGISQDITERRHAEEQIRRQAQLIDLSHDPIMVWSPERGIVQWNLGAQRLYGYTQAEALGRNIHDLLHTQDAVSKEGILASVESTGQWTGELRHRAKDGREIVVESRQQAIRMIDERLVLESNRDITERKRVEEALREADRRKDEYIAVLAHELRNPLAPVRNAVEVLRRLGLGEPRLERARDVIDRQVSHMARLIDDLLDVSRVARGKLALQTCTCDLAAIARQTAEDYRASLEGAGLSLVARAAETPLWVEGDPVRLAQMIGNLLNNAGRFTEPGGRVEVSTELDTANRVAIVRVADSGVGIEPALLARLFDPFSQADQDLARTKGGLGLGLALTKGLAELHGGGVSAHSEGRGRGSTFTLRVPLSKARYDSVPPERRTGDGRQLRILVVEDNEDAAESLGDLLELSGHQVALAFDGAAALATAAELRPDVVISDLGLPGELDGYAVARWLRADPALSRSYLIALSGYANEEARRRSRAAGFDAHLAKPPDLAMLERALADAAHR